MRLKENKMLIYFGVWALLSLIKGCRVNEVGSHRHFEHKKGTYFLKFVLSV